MLFTKSQRMKLVDEHTRVFVEEVFAKRLREEGFVNSNDNLNAWCRYRSKDIINTIHFFTPTNMIPVFLSIVSGITPSYFPVFCEKHVQIEGPLFAWEHDEHMLVADDQSKTQLRNYSAYSSVMAPTKNGYGIFTFDKIILPEMDRVETLDACYSLHKDKYFKPVGKFGYGAAGPGFMDEVIYYNDAEAIPRCLEHAKYMVDFLEKPSPHKLSKKAIEERKIEAFEHRKRIAALEGSGREAYLEELKQRSEQCVLDMQKHYGIVL